MVKYLYLRVFSINHSYIDVTRNLRTTTVLKTGDISHSGMRKFQCKVNFSFEGGVVLTYLFILDCPTVQTILIQMGSLDEN